MAFGGTEVAETSNRFLVLHEQWQLLLELCHFTEELNPLWETKSLQTKLKNICHDFLREVGELDSSEERFSKVNHFFFKDLGFETANFEDLSLQNSFIPHVLTSKKGPAVLLMLLMCCLLEECGITSEVSSCRKKHLLKVHINGRSFISDFDDNGRFLEPYEIVELINRGFDFSNGSLSHNCLVVEYLHLLRDKARNENKLQILSHIHSYLMKYQPFNLRHISERAMVAFETGDYRTAVDDIRNYFQYKQADFTNEHLKRIYKLALRKTRSL